VRGIPVSTPINRYFDFPDIVDTKNILMKEIIDNRRHTMDEEKYLACPDGSKLVKTKSLLICANLYATNVNYVVTPLPQSATRCFVYYGTKLI
jgi:hypothetical protein